MLWFEMHLLSKLKSKQMERIKVIIWNYGMLYHLFDEFIDASLQYVVCVIEILSICGKTLWDSESCVNCRCQTSTSTDESKTTKKNELTRCWVFGPTIYLFPAHFFPSPLGIINPSFKYLPPYVISKKGSRTKRNVRRRRVKREAACIHALCIICTLGLLLPFFERVHLWLA